MGPIELVAAGVVLLVAVVVGTVAHELSHAAVLAAFDIPYRIEWLPARAEAGLLRAGVLGGWASVTPRTIPPGLAPWRLRVAALAPLALAAPFVLVLGGVVPDPIASGNPLVQAATVGWMACALPSPADFSLFSHAGRAIEEYGDRE